jgi:RNA polymerase sigma factor (sigma-70 family)
MMIVPYCSSEGEKKLACAQAGCEVCLEKLVKEYAGLICAAVHAQNAWKADFGDLIQEGRIGLWKAVRGFDPQRGVRFSSYAWVAIRNRVWDAVAYASKIEGWQEGQRAQDQLGELISSWQSAQIRQALSEELEHLPDRLRQLIILHYGFDGAAPQNLSEIGRAWGLSRERVRQLHNDALVLLRLPALSIHLRSIYERQNEENYQQALRQNRTWLRKQRQRR